MPIRNIKIDFLKGAAMILVILLHSFQMIENFPALLKAPFLFGQIGVQLFLVCSGLLVVKTIFSKITSIKSYFIFIFKKYISMAILFALFLCIYVVINILFNNFGLKVPYNNSIKPVSIILNVLLLHGLSPVCLNNVVPGAWYVGTLFLLFLMCPLFKFKTKNSYKIAAAVISVLSVILSIILSRYGINTDNGSYFYFSFFNQLPAFLIGMGMGLSEQSKPCPVYLTISKSVLEFLVCLILFVIELDFSCALIPIFAALAFENVYDLLELIPYQKLQVYGKPLIYIGANTYPIYLGHFLFVWYIPIIINNLFDTHWLMLWVVALITNAVLCAISSKINLINSRITKYIYQILNI